MVAGPTVLKLDKEGKAVVTDPSSVNDDKLNEIAESCPLYAIIIEDDNGNQTYP